MGFPSLGFESLFRNSLSDIQSFFATHHDDRVKVYNLCLECSRIYSKERFPRLKVALFPSLDHNPCQVRLIIEFCIDLSLFLVNNPSSVAAVHCKAGKGRTGVMICSYLLFSGLCSSLEEAIEHYADKRTHNKQGVTIRSQIRYINYFYTYLNFTYKKPYICMIPRILKHKIKSTNSKNILRSLATDLNFHVTLNKFRVKRQQIGVFDYDPKKITVNTSNNKAKINKLELKSEKTENGFVAVLNEEFEVVGCDINYKSKVNKKSFNFWFNLYFETLNYLLELGKPASKINEDGIEELYLHDMMEKLKYTEDLNEIADEMERIGGVEVNRNYLVATFKQDEFDGSLRKSKKEEKMEFLIEYSLCPKVSMD